MNTLKISKADVSGRNYTPYLLFGGLLLTCPLLQVLIMSWDPMMGFIDPNIWLLILMSLICFLAVTGLSWWLLQRFWTRLGLPLLTEMVLSFKKMELWQQLGFYWASFALLLLAAVGVLTAIV
ncbi:hypothetical protein SAMN04487898_105194 [Pedobacter sp. ok626]|uniref:hypothetical protein n=1 Tax=Pedobacter sp. ok626 TaxID=1761882 RepID=UPI000883C8E1|nr:hypothetical protein [Pedobacter sp. ok626]SDJ97640.1 hypothetical protein SAMN04487898_105194 [Pedobacter sp. ok626]